jgi:SpoU rRNA methylase family enzyme
VVEKRNNLINDMAEYYINISKKEIDEFSKLASEFKIHTLTQTFITRGTNDNRDLIVIEKFSDELFKNYLKGGGTVVKMLEEMQEAVRIMSGTI